MQIKFTKLNPTFEVSTSYMFNGLKYNFIIEQISNNICIFVVRDRLSLTIDELIEIQNYFGIDSAIDILPEDIYLLGKHHLADSIELANNMEYREAAEILKSKTELYIMLLMFIVNEF